MEEEGYIIDELRDKIDNIIKNLNKKCNLYEDDP